MQIRPATEADLERVLELLRSDVVRATSEPSAVTAAQRAAMVELVADPCAEVLVGEVDGAVVATAQVNWLRHLTHDGGLICQVEAVRVDGSYRGRGLGSALLADVIEQARSRGAVRLQLTSNVRREEAHRFYQRLGFEPSHVGMKLYLGGER